MVIQEGPTELGSLTTAYMFSVVCKPKHSLPNVIPSGELLFHSARVVPSTSKHKAPPQSRLIGIVVGYKTGEMNISEVAALRLLHAYYSATSFALCTVLI